MVGYSLESYKYTVSFTSTGQLNPSTVAIENFAVYGKDENPVEITDVLYEPRSNKITLTVLPGQMTGRDCTVELKSGLMYLDTNQSIGEITQKGSISSEYLGILYGVSVKGITLFDKETGAAITCPASNRPFDVTLTVTNATNEQQIKTLMVYKNHRTDEPFINAEIVVPANSAMDFTYEINGILWDDDDFINTCVL